MPFHKRDNLVSNTAPNGTRGAPSRRFCCVQDTHTARLFAAGTAVAPACTPSSRSLNMAAR